jgi:hypothetical protein
MGGKTEIMPAEEARSPEGRSLAAILCLALLAAPAARADLLEMHPPPAAAAFRWSSQAGSYLESRPEGDGRRTTSLEQESAGLLPTDHILELLKDFHLEAARTSWLRPPASEPPAASSGRCLLQQVIPPGSDPPRESCGAWLYSDETITSGGRDPWSFTWSGQFSCDGPDFLHTTWEGGGSLSALGQVVFSRRFEGGGFFRAGRYTPPEIPAAGQLDGLQGEMALSSHFRAGVIAGLKPDRQDLEFSQSEPISVAYLAARAGSPGVLQYSGSLGCLGTLHEGDPDRLALLLSQSVAVGPWLNLCSSTEVDVAISSPESSDGELRLTAASMSASMPVGSILTLRAGLDHRKRPDTSVERVLAGAGGDPAFEEATFRRWAGFSRPLPFDLSLDVEVSLFDGPWLEETSEGWTVTLARAGIPGFPGSRVGATASGLEGFEKASLAARVWMDLPLPGKTLFLRPGAGFQYLQDASRGDGIELTDFSLNVEWRASERVSFLASSYQVLGNSIDEPLLTVAMQCTW